MRSPSIIPLLSTFAVAAFSLFSAVLSPIAHANLVVNGGFEADPVPVVGFGGTAVGGGDAATINGSLANWQSGGTGPNNVLATNQNIYYATASNGDANPSGLGPYTGGPHTGDLAAVFPNTPNFDGYISQSVAGVVGGYIYKIGFWLSNQIGNDPNNYMDVRWGGDIVGNTVNGYSLTGGSPALPGAIPVPTAWTYYEFITGAPSDGARLSFIGGNTAAANLIDDVSVEFYAVPEVSSFGMVIGFGLLALGTMGRMRRRSFATA